MPGPVPPSPLNARTLPLWSGVMPLPAYDRDQVTAGVVHIGAGGFHRAHQAMYLDRLMNGGAALDWGICGVGLLPADRPVKEAMDAQDGLYTLVIQHSDGTWEPRVIGSIVEYLYAPDDPEAVVEKMAASSTRIVSLTITEGGYHVSDATGEFDPAHPGVIADLVPGASPRTAFGIIAEALRRRRDRRIPPFTVMSCDNLPGNGDLTRRVCTAFARLRDPALGAWIDREVQFPNSMVDRITPVTTDAGRAGLRERFGIDDRWPVACEPFAQWVLQDAFSSGRPPYEDAGVQLVSDVEPYELMKLRLLNGSHQAANPRHHRPRVRLQLGPDTQVRAARHPPSARPRRRDHALSGRSWARYAEGTDEQGEPIDVIDRLSDSLIPLARRQRTDPTALISNQALFGTLAQNHVFIAAYVSALSSLHQRGARATLESLALR